MTLPGWQLLSPARPPSAMELAQSESRAAMRAAGQVTTALTSRGYGLSRIPKYLRRDEHGRGALDDQRTANDTPVQHDERATRSWWLCPCVIIMKFYYFRLSRG